MIKEYQVSDLFYTSWKELTPMRHAGVFALHMLAKTIDKESPKYGYHLIWVLRNLRKDKSLVNKINEAQAVDIYNDLKFLDEPWYHFPVKVLPAKSFLLYAPDEYMSRHSFDHFIYADNEFTSYLATMDRKYLVRLAATLYRKKGEIHFDKEQVESRAALLSKKITPYQEELVFLTFGHIREFITKRCRTLLPSSKSGGDEKVSPTGPMWLKLKHRLAESPAFQGYETSGRANVYSALDYLEDLAKIKEKK